MAQRLIAFAVLVVALLASVVAIRTTLSVSKQPDRRPVSSSSAGDEAGLAAVAERLAAAIRIQTITYEDTSRIDPDAFTQLHEMLRASYPVVHASLRREIVGEKSLLYTWPGQDASLPPIVLSAHLDVVPAPVDASEAWTYPPFEGRIEEGHLWGRGAIDDKAAVISMMEAVRGLLNEGFHPQRTIFLAFGHDEERGGYSGAARMARILKARGVTPAFVLDEGLFVTEGIVPGISTPVALVGTAEKGAANVELSVATSGGHASMPPAETALGLLSRSVARLERNPFPARLDGAARTMFEYLAPEMTLGQRIAFANLWLFGPLVRRRLAGAPSTNALLRTTVAPTIIEGGEKVNALPGHARAVLNVRLLPNDDLESLTDRIRRTVDDDRILVRLLDGASEASPVSPVDTPPFAAIQQVIRDVFPGAVVAPALMIARTDARHYAALTNHVFRFTPVRLHADDLARIHGVDERLSLAGLAQSVRFYRALFRTTAGAGRRALRLLDDDERAAVGRPAGGQAVHVQAVGKVRGVEASLLAAVPLPAVDERRDFPSERVEYLQRHVRRTGQLVAYRRDAARRIRCTAGEDEVGSHFGAVLDGRTDVRAVRAEGEVRERRQARGTHLRRTFICRGSLRHPW